MEKNKQKQSISRRGFIGTSLGAAAIFNIVPRHVLGGPNFVAPSEKVNIAVVGTGGQGRSNIRHLFNEPEAQIIAVADPMESVNLDNFYFKGMGGRKPVKAEIEKNYQKKTPNYKCAEYEDFRIMLEKEKAIDAILCATPDHLHAYVSVIAMRNGKHIYCEKPLTHNIREARLVARVAKETGLATQMGNQGHSKEGIRQTVEYLRDGAIGEVRETHSWVPAGRWNPGLTGYPKDTPAIPAGLNWDLWLGPREKRPYHPAYVPVAWRDFWTYGCGALGDFGCHDLDSAVWAYDLKAPETVEAHSAGFMSNEIAPYGETCVYKFPAKGKRPPMTVNWYSGGLQPPRPDYLPEGMNLPRRGVLFVGEKGIIQCDGAGGAARLFPGELRKSYKKPAKTLRRSEGHHKDWLNAIKGGPKACSNFDYAAQLTEITLLGIVALQAQKECKWDAENMKLIGCDRSDEFINGSYRKGWEVV
ncbi:MAG: Gfo/Idh/MocA family oxidoreductase [Kiritimatiellae bacterium]|jgi:predicted dehydrogenase|nr:Gfo/Idh/MocA family oxidoreductase [Kiritimatiellia bacterium]